jgi:hypothetical protein
MVEIISVSESSVDEELNEVVERSLEAVAVSHQLVVVEVRHATVLRVPEVKKSNQIHSLLYKSFSYLNILKYNREKFLFNLKNCNFDLAT